MVFSSEKDERMSGTVDKAAPAAPIFSGSQNTMNPNLVVSLMIQPFALMAMSTALTLVAMKQISGHLLSALESNLEGSKNAVQEAKSSPAARAAEPAIRIIVDNSVKAEVNVPKLAMPGEAVVKPAKTSLKSPSVKKTVDDLKRISGIGPKLEKVLQGKGITAFSDIAKLSKPKADALDQELGLGGRIKRDQWVENAKALVKEQG